MKQVILILLFFLKIGMLHNAQASLLILQKERINDFEESANFSFKILTPLNSVWYVEVIILALLISLIIGLIYALLITRKRLHQAKIEKNVIENCNRRIDFLTNITHEMLTPLSLVLSPVEDLMKNHNHADSEWKNHIEMIYRNTRYIQKLIKQIIIFNKHKEGKLSLNVSDTNLSELISNVSSHFQGQIKLKDIKLDLHLPDFEIITKVDAQKIEEVLYNLIYNAVKITDQGSKIIVTLDVCELTGNKESVEKQVKISIFNESAGLLDINKEMITERSSNQIDESDGAGIGLWNSKLLVEMHGGKIEVESTEGIGVTFQVYLPIIKSDRLVEAVQLEKESENIFTDRFNKFQTKSDFESEELLKIVIAEDNDELRNFLVQVFSRDYECYSAGDGNEAYKIITEIIPDVIILDVVMPGIDGLQTCLMVKENRSTCHIPVLLLTAKDADEQIISGFKNGADAYITKPFNTDVLLSQVSRLIRNRELIREKYLTQNFMVEIADSLPSKDDEFIFNLRKILEDNISDADFNVNKLSRLMNISTTQLYRKLKTLTGYSPVEFMRIIKLQKACALLNQRKNTIKEVCYMVGFNNLSYFVKCFREYFGVTPAVYRDQGLTEQVNVETNEEQSQ